MTSAAVLELVYPYLVAGALAVARVLGVISVTPAFTRLGLTGIIRGGVALALALPLVPMVVEVVAPTGSVSAGHVAALIAKEVIVGVVIGLVYGIPFWAAELMGEVLDLQRGVTIATLIDPSAVSESSITATFLVLALVMLFFVSGGFDVMMSGLYASYRIWPVTAIMPVFDPSAGETILKLMDDLMRFGLRLAIPIVVALLFTDLALALLARTAPQLNLFDLSLSAKSLVFSFLLLIYSVFLLEYLNQDLTRLSGAEALLQALSATRR